MNRAARLFAVVLAWLALAAPSFAQAVHLQLEPSELTVGQTGRMQLIFVDGRVIGDPRFPVPDGLEIVKQSTSRQMESTPGRRTILYVWTYTVRVNREGEYRLGDWEFTLDNGAKVKSGAARLRAVPRGTETQELSLEAGFGVDEAWEGQVVVYTYKLVARMPVTAVDWRLPAFDGFRVPTTGQPDRGEYTIGDAEAGLITVNRGAIPWVATGTGDRTQPAALAYVRVVTGPTTFRNFMAPYRSETVVGETSPLVVHPLTDPPSGFSGLVGDFAFTSVLDRRVAAVGESVGWTIKVDGNGALDGWKPPRVPDDAPVSEYDSDPVIDAGIRDDRYIARALFPRVLVPTRPGDHDLPDLEIVTFSPTKRAYETHTLELGHLKVTGTAEPDAAVESFGGQAPTGEAAVVDFRDNYRWGLDRTPPLYGAGALAAAVGALPSVWFVLLFGLESARERWRRRAEARYRPPPASARLVDLPDDPHARLAVFDAALRQGIADHLGLPLATLDRAAAIARLPDGLRERVGALGAALDRTRFSGGEPADLEAEVRDVVRALEAT